MGATELPEFQPADRLSVEDREHGPGGSLSNEKGNATRDEVEMSRMGKTQELRVRYLPFSSNLSPNAC